MFNSINATWLQPQGDEEPTISIQSRAKKHKEDKAKAMPKPPERYKLMSVPNQKNDTNDTK